MTVVTGRFIPIYVPDVDAILDAGTYTSVRLYVATSQTAAGALLTTITLTAGQTAYSYDDASGTAGSWYYTTYYSTLSLLESDPSERTPGQGAPSVTRATLVQRTADRLGLYGRIKGNHTFPGPSGTTTSAGNAGGTTAVCTSYADSEYPAREFTHWYLRATSGAASGEERRLTTEPLTTASGTFTAARAFTVAGVATQIVSGVTFELYGGISGDEWRQALNEALLDSWTPVEWPLAGATNQTEYALPYFIEDRAQIENLVARTGATLRDHSLTGGVDFLLKMTEGGGGYIYVPGGLGTNAAYTVEGWRHPAMLFADTDTLVIGEQSQRILILGAAMRGAQRLARKLGSDTDTTLMTQLRDELEKERQGLSRERGGFNTLRNPRQSQMVQVSSSWRRW